jgi:protein TonB
MAKPQLYRPAPKWPVWASFGGACLITSLSVVLAGIRPEEPPPADLSQIPEAVMAVLETEPAPPEPEPPPEEPDIPPPPPPPEAVPEFREEQPTPPPQDRPKTKAPQQPIRRQTGPSGPSSISGAKVAAVFSPRPEYPYEARKRKQTGSGVCVLTVDVPSGNVTSAEMTQSTGSPILDTATTNAFKRWRFRANSVAPKVKVPITYTLTGAQF